MRRQAGKIIRILISYFTDDPDSSEAEGENNDDVTSQEEEEEEEEDHTHPYLKQWYVHISHVSVNLFLRF